MIAVARLVSLLALAATIGPALLFFGDQFTLDQTKAWMLAAAVLWFATAPIWMDRRAAP
jgi:hypothetical protein